MLFTFSRQLEHGITRGRSTDTLISGAIVAGTLRGLPPPRPVVDRDSCLPPALNVTGKPWTDVPSRVSHRIAPVLTSNARNLRSRSPTNATPPAVERAAVRERRALLVAPDLLHRRARRTPRACRRCRSIPASRRSADRRWSRRCLPSARPSVPHISMHDWLSGMMSTPVGWW